MTVGPWGAAFALAIFLALSVEATTPARRTVETLQVAPSPMRPDLGGPCSEWGPLALDVGWPLDEWPTVGRVMACESGCDPAAHNPSGASGLMQLMPMWWAGRDPFDPATNLALALHVHAVQGWRAWSCY